MAGLIYCGDNLDVLREYIPRESVDLIYLDPPFNSQRTYNLVYKGQRAQEEAFKDFWSWEETAPAYSALIESAQIPRSVRTLLRALHDLLIETDPDQLAYLTMMAPRLVALHRALKSTGSMYLHCDPTASHYLKVVLDAIFDSRNFRSEIVWKRSGAHSDTKQGRAIHGHIHDTLLFYTKSDEWTWNPIYTKYDDAYVERDYALVDEGGRRFRRGDLTAAKPGGDVEYKWRVKRHRGVRERWLADLDDEFQSPSPGWEYKATQPYKGRYWAYSKENLKQFAREGRLRHTFDGMPEYKRYLDEMPGVSLQDVWTDIPPITAGAKEKLGYPTQKPVALLARIIQSSSNVGDVVLDPFCGCGTTVEASERLGRRWIGIDIARKAVEVIEHRFKKVELSSPGVVWHPADKGSAEALASRDKLGFEKWVVRKIRAARLRKKDRGIDGEAHFRQSDGRIWNVVVSVKGGQTLPPTHARDLRGVIEREKAIGVLVSLIEPSKEVRHEASRAGFLSEHDAEGPIPRMQLVTVDRLFSEFPPIRCPGKNVTEMPKASLPPPPGVGDQLALELTAKARPSRPRVASAKPRKQSAKTYPIGEPEMLAVAESVRPSRK